MADKKISQLPLATTPLDGTEILPIVQSGTTVKTPISEFTTASQGYTPSSSGAIPRSIASKLNETISVFDFMTAAQKADVLAGTASIDIGPAFNAAFAVIRSAVSSGIGNTTLVVPPGTYYVATGINGTNIRTSNDGGVVHISGYGATILGNCSGKPVFDFIRTNMFKIYGLNVIGNSTNKPLCAFQFGRGVNGETASNMAFIHVRTYGYFTRCAVYNLASEQTYYQHCNFIINGTGAGQYAVILDGINYYNASSDYYSMSVPQYAQQSFLNNTFINTSMRGGVSGDTGSALLMIETKNLTALNSYCVARGNQPAIVVGVYNNGRCIATNLDIHCETNSGTGLSHWMYFKDLGGGTTSLTMDGLTVREPTSQALTAFFGSNLSGRVQIIDANIYVAALDTGAANVVFDHNRYNLIGRLNWSVSGTYPGGIAIDFCTGELWAPTFVGATLPLNGTFKLYYYAGSNPLARQIAAGNSITQTTNKTTGVTINATCGKITTSNSALAAGAIDKFTVTNSYVTADDVILLHRKTGGSNGAYNFWVDSTSTGSFDICIRNVSSGSLSEAIIINFSVVNTSIY